MLNFVCRIASKKSIGLKKKKVKGKTSLGKDGKKKSLAAKSSVKKTKSTSEKTKASPGKSGDRDGGQAKSGGDASSRKGSERDKFGFYHAPTQSSASSTSQPKGLSL